jgi:MFS transporter, DHA2 family, multidrug resistance protein
MMRIAIACGLVFGAVALRPPVATAKYSEKKVLSLQIARKIVQRGRTGLILASCIGSSFLTVYWNRDQFYSWQLLEAVGQPMVVMALLMMATNTVGPTEGPFASALINTSRALAEAAGAWFVALIDRWRNALHYDRLVD